VGSDLREGKVTLPLIYALEEATPDERRMVETVLRENSYETVPVSQIRQFLERRHGVQRAKQRAQAFAEKARTLISEFPDSPYQRALFAVTELVTDREF
jgi:octaprenyl-diphosphate synthase